MRLDGFSGLLFVLGASVAEAFENFGTATMLSAIFGLIGLGVIIGWALS